MTSDMEDEKNVSFTVGNQSLRFPLKNLLKFQSCAQKQQHQHQKQTNKQTNKQKKTTKINNNNSKTDVRILTAKNGVFDIYKEFVQNLS